MTNKILIVEDEEDILTGMLVAMEEAGYSCQVARTGPEALIAATAFLPDLVLLDLTIPGLDGLEVCLRMKQEQSTAAAKVIMVTARTQPSDRFLGREVGADDYITKPFALDELVLKAQTVLAA